MGNEHTRFGRRVVGATSEPSALHPVEDLPSLTTIPSPRVLLLLYPSHRIGPCIGHNWIDPIVSIGRILDKCLAGTADGWTFDMHPAPALRLITGAPHLTKTEAMPPGEWIHVPAVANTEIGNE
jgi:hypothetical protein